MFDVRVYNAHAGTRNDLSGVYQIPFVRRSGQLAHGVLSEREWFTPLVQVRSKGTSQISGSSETAVTEEDVLTILNGNLASATPVINNAGSWFNLWYPDSEITLSCFTRIDIGTPSGTPPNVVYPYSGEKTVFEWRFLVRPFSLLIPADNPSAFASLMHFDFGTLEIFHINSQKEYDRDSMEGWVPPDPDEWTSQDEAQIDFADNEQARPDPENPGSWDPINDAEDWSTPWSSVVSAGINKKIEFIPRIVRTALPNSRIGPICLANKSYEDAAADPDYNPFLPAPP